MKKLEIEVLGRMYQDWDNEEFSWDVYDSIFHKSLFHLLMHSKYQDFWKMI
jgi:hypothetical protein